MNGSRHIEQGNSDAEQVFCWSRFPVFNALSFVVLLMAAYVTVFSRKYLMINFSTQE